MHWQKTKNFTTCQRTGRGLQRFDPAEAQRFDVAQGYHPGQGYVRTEFDVERVIWVSFVVYGVGVGEQYRGYFGHEPVCVEAKVALQIKPDMFHQFQVELCCLFGERQLTERFVIFIMERYPFFEPVAKTAAGEYFALVIYTFGRFKPRENYPVFFEWFFVIGCQHTHGICALVYACQVKPPVKTMVNHLRVAYNCSPGFHVVVKKQRNIDVLFCQFLLFTAHPFVHHCIKHFYTRFWLCPPGHKAGSEFKACNFHHFFRSFVFYTECFFCCFYRSGVLLHHFAALTRCGGGTAHRGDAVFHQFAAFAHRRGALSQCTGAMLQ